jgi:hypothetical protein
MQIPQPHRQCCPHVQQRGGQLHGINLYEYLVDVLQRVAQHPASQVQDLTHASGSACSHPIRLNPTYINPRINATTSLNYRLFLCCEHD